LNCNGDFESTGKNRKFCSPSCSSTYNNIKRRGHSEETKKKMRRPHPSTQGENNPAKRPEVRKKIKEALKGRDMPWSYKWRGQKRPNTSKSLLLAYKEGRAKPNKYRNGGYREDLEKYFRSSWEANFARCLNYLGIQWLYELSVFVLEIAGRETTYRPDFYLPKMKLYVEIKGYWVTDLSKKKFESFAESHPILLIELEEYQILTEKFAHKIKNWED